jgi:divalent metal cation (Fe/Co/Zn/Cd) transporter
LQQLLLLLVLRLYQLSKVISSAGLLVLVASKVAVCFVRTSAAILADAILVA